MLLGLLMLSSGCVTEEVINPDAIQVRLFVTRAGGGEETHISWLSEKELIYTVLYADRLDAQAQWKTLEGAIQLRGTGKNIELTDRVPVGVDRYYRLHVVTAQGDKRR